MNDRIQRAAPPDSPVAGQPGSYLVITQHERTFSVALTSRPEDHFRSGTEIVPLSSIQRVNIGECVGEDAWLSGLICLAIKLVADAENPHGKIVKAFGMDVVESLQVLQRLPVPVEGMEAYDPHTWRGLWNNYWYVGLFFGIVLIAILIIVMTIHFGSGAFATGIVLCLIAKVTYTVLRLWRKSQKKTFATEQTSRSISDSICPTKAEEVSKKLSELRQLEHESSEAIRAPFRPSREP